MIATKCEKNDYLITQPFAPVSLDTTKHEKGWNYFGQPIYNFSEDWGFFSSSLCPSLLDTMTVAGQYSGVYPSIYGATETVLSPSDTHNLCTPTLVSDTTSPLCLSTPSILDQQDIQSKRTQCDPQLVSQPMLDAPRLEQPQQVTIAPSVLKRNSDLDLDTASRSIEDAQVDITPGMNSSADYARQRELPHGYDEK